MKKLMKEEPFEKISVSDICSDCGINRKSFYYHFRDKYDLVNWIFYVGFVGEMDLNSYRTGWDWIADICIFFYRERDFYRCALEIEGQNSFRDYLIDTVRPVAEFFLRDSFPEEGSREFQLTFVIDALLTSIVRWLSGGYDTKTHKYNAEEFVSEIHEIVRRIGEKK